MEIHDGNSTYREKTNDNDYWNRYFFFFFCLLKTKKINERWGEKFIYVARKYIHIYEGEDDITFKYKNWKWK